MPIQEYGFHPSTDCLADGNGDCSYFITANQIWFEKDDGSPEDANYMNFAISLFTSQQLIDQCDDGEDCFPNLGGFKFSFNFCLNGNYNSGDGFGGGKYSPIIIDRVTAAGDNTGFQGGYEYYFYNYGDNEANDINPLYEGTTDTQCLSATITAQAFGGASSGWSLGTGYPGMTLANVRVKFRGDGLDVINPDLDDPYEFHPFRGTYGIGGHPEAQCYQNAGDPYNDACVAGTDYGTQYMSPPPTPFNNQGNLCQYRNVSDGMGAGFYCTGNAYYSGDAGTSRDEGFRCRDHVYPADDSTYKFGWTEELLNQDEAALLNYCRHQCYQPESMYGNTCQNLFETAGITEPVVEIDGVDYISPEPLICGYCDSYFPIECDWWNAGFGDAGCEESYGNDTSLSDLNNCLRGNWDCVSDVWTRTVGVNHAGPSYPAWNASMMPPGNITFDIVRHSQCCSGDPDEGDCLSQCGSYVWDTNGQYLNPWTWIPSTWIIHDVTDNNCTQQCGGGTAYCADDFYTGCGDNCCCTNPPFDTACLDIARWYEIFGCTEPQGCDYNEEATESTYCTYPYGTADHLDNYFTCQSGQGCPRLFHDVDGDGLSAGSGSVGGSKYFCPVKYYNTAGYACMNWTQSFPLYVMSSLDMCEILCNPDGTDTDAECVAVRRWQKHDGGSSSYYPGNQVPDLETGVESFCDPHADYSEFDYNHCEPRGSYGGAGFDHPSFNCPNEVILDSNQTPSGAFPGACFVDTTGDLVEDCAWDTWECDPVTNDPNGQCVRPEDISVTYDQCGQCGGSGESCSAYGHCDQNSPPSNHGGEWSQCLIWGGEGTWDPFPWPFGCGNSYCFAQQKCPGGDNFSTDDICYSRGYSENPNPWCQPGFPCWWECEGGYACGCTYGGNCMPSITENASEVSWGGLGTCEGTGKVEFDMWYCQNVSYISDWTGENFYVQDGRCFFNKTPYCGTRAPWNGLGCSCDVQCSYYFDCCHGACDHCNEAWRSGVIPVDVNYSGPEYQTNTPGGWTGNNGIWPICLRYDNSYFYDETSFDHLSLTALQMYCPECVWTDTPYGCEGWDGTGEWWNTYIPSVLVNQGAPPPGPDSEVCSCPNPNGSNQCGILSDEVCHYNLNGNPCYSCWH